MRIFQHTHVGCFVLKCTLTSDCEFICFCLSAPFVLVATSYQLISIRVRGAVKAEGEQLATKPVPRLIHPEAEVEPRARSCNGPLHAEGVLPHRLGEGQRFGVPRKGHRSGMTIAPPRPPRVGPFLPFLPGTRDPFDPSRDRPSPGSSRKGPVWTSPPDGPTTPPPEN